MYNYIHFVQIQPNDLFLILNKTIFSHVCESKTMQQARNNAHVATTTKVKCEASKNPLLYDQSVRKLRKPERAQAQQAEDLEI